MQDPITVAEAARLLKLSPSRVRLMASKGQLPGTKIGDRWVIERRAVEQRRQQKPQRGRRFTPRNAWAILLLASGEEAPALDPVNRSRLRKALALEGLKGLEPRLSARAEVFDYKAHSGEVPYALKDEALLLSGISPAGSVDAGLLSGREAEGYIAQSQLQSFVAEHALSPADVDGNVRLRVVPVDLWVSLELGSRAVAPPAAVTLDLAEDLDPRSRAAGRNALREVDRAVRTVLKARGSAVSPVKARSVIHVDPIAGEAKSLWSLMLQLAEALGSEREWSLIGGLMVQLHGLEHRAHR